MTPSGHEANTEHAASVSMLEGLDMSMCDKFANEGGIMLTNGCDEELGNLNSGRSSERCEHFDELEAAVANRRYCGVPAVLAATVAFLLALYEMLVLKTAGSIQSAAADWDAKNAAGPWRPKNLRRALAIATGAAAMLQIASAIITSPSFTPLLPPEHIFGPGDALIGLQDVQAGDLEDPDLQSSFAGFVWASMFTLAAVVINWRTPWRRATAERVG